MKHRELRSIIKKRLKKIDGALDLAKLKYGEDELRLFRVKVKKLQSFLNLINSGKKEADKAQLPEKINRFYQVAGSIRNLQIQEEHVRKSLAGKKDLLPENYLASLTARLLHLKSIAGKLITKEKPFAKGGRKLLTALPGNISSKEISNFKKKRASDLKKLLKPVFPSDESLHLVRKLLKDLLYTWPYIGKNDLIVLPYSLLSNNENIDPFTVALGSFHDQSMALQLLYATSLHGDVQDSERSILFKMEKIWKKEKETARGVMAVQLQKIIASREDDPTVFDGKHRSEADDVQ